MKISEELATRDARIAELEAIVEGASVSANTELTELRAKFDLLVESEQSLSATVETLKGQLSAAENETEALKAEAKSAEARALEIVAGFGVAQTELPKKAASEPEAVLTRAEFNQLSPNDRLAFVKAGGTLN